MNTNNNFSTQNSQATPLASDLQSTPYGASDRDSWSVMFEHLYDDLLRLYQRERELIRTEVKEKTTEAKAAVTSMAVGWGLLLVGGFALAATAIISLNLVMPLWAAAGTVTLILLVIGTAVVIGAKKKLDPGVLAPRKSIDTLGEIKTAFKERYHEFKTITHH